MGPRKCYAWSYVESVGDFRACLLCGKVYSSGTGIHGVIPHLEHPHGLFAEVHAQPKRVAEILRQHDIDDLDKRRQEVRKQLQTGNVPSHPSASVGSKTNRQRASFIWHYAERVDGVTHCLICGKQSRRKGATASSDLPFHLESHHGITKALHFEHPEKVAEMLKQQGVSDLEQRRRSVREQQMKPFGESKPIACAVKNELTNASASPPSPGLGSDSDDESDVELIGGSASKRLQKKPKAKQSFVWTYFARFANSKECLICGARLSAVSPTSVDFATKIEKNKHALSTAVSYWRYDDDGSTPAIVKQPDVVPPMQKRCRPRKLDSVQSLEADAGHVEAEFEAAPAATASANSGIARLEKEIEEDKERLKKLRAELIALEFEEASFLNSGPVSGPVTAAKQTDIRQYCEVMRRENVASTKKQVELIQPSTRQATIGEFFKTV
ncbi:hypothetical protein AAVH_18029 [Aphelenchoides avenae]|nr:hypothetical protein AAVH_18029 [Aphelenchus avenae]